MEFITSLACLGRNAGVSAGIATKNEGCKQNWRRQDQIWKLADDVLSDEELLRITTILTLRPDELPDD